MGRRTVVLITSALLGLLLVPTAAGADTHCTITESTRLTADITDCGKGIIIGADNVALDGRGFSLRADGPGSGITIDGRTNVTINNLTLIDFLSGAISIVDSENIRIQKVSFDLPIGMASFGMSIRGSHEVSITNSDLGKANGTNLVIDDSSRVQVRGNDIRGGGNQQIWVRDSNRVTVTGNTISSGDNFFPMVTLINTDRSWFTSNALNDEFVVGFSVDADSERNWFLRNSTQGWGFADTSSGHGTAGTANRYLANVCNDTQSGIDGSSTPDGQCEVGPAL